MGWFLMFVLGIIVGVIAAWWFFERRDATSRIAIEEGWKKKLAHVEQEVRRADVAHEETKERLRLLQQEKIAQQMTPPAAPPAPVMPPVAASVPPSAAPRPPATPPKDMPVKDMEPGRPSPESQAPVSQAPVSQAPESQAKPPVLSGPSEAERRAQARRRIDAKLAQLPAGSSARARLVAERAAIGEGEIPANPAAAASAPVRLFTPPADKPDDIEMIRGIGPVLRVKLNELGITTFKQIAALSPEDIQRIDAVLDFRGRIEREDWIGQARTLGGLD